MRPVPDLQKIAVKLPLLVPRSAVDAFLPIFAAWRDAAPADWVDLADNAHVGAGLAVQLVGRRCTVGVDLDPPAGLSYLHKNGLTGSDTERACAALASALQLAARLFADPALPPTVLPQFDRVWLGVNDRVWFPNDDATEAALAAPFGAALDRLYGPGAWTRSPRAADPRERFGWWIHPANVPASFEALRALLSG